MPMIKQAGIKESEIDYSVIGGPQLLPKLVASLEAGNPPGITRLGSGDALLYRSQGHLLEVTDLVDKMQHAPGGLFDFSLSSVLYKGKAYGVRSPSARGHWSPGWTCSSGLRRAPHNVGGVRRGLQAAAETAEAPRLWHVPGALQRCRQ